jgi:hypothetical protein
MNTTPIPFGPDFIKSIIPWMLQTIDEIIRNYYHIFWDIFMSFISKHWGWILITLTCLLILAIVIALIGRWGFLGSLLYNYLYFGFLFILGLIKGPEIFLSEYFEILCLLILYPICYLTVRYILDKYSLR